jgi:hypothetical protein
MAEQETALAAWKFVAYVEGGVIVTLAGTIVAMAKWFTGERKEMTAQYQTLNAKIAKALDRIGNYLRDWYNERHPDKASHTEFDFKGEDH